MQNFKKKNRWDFCSDFQTLWTSQINFYNRIGKQKSFCGKTTIFLSELSSGTIAFVVIVNKKSIEYSFKNRERILWIQWKCIDYWLLSCRPGIKSSFYFCTISLNYEVATGIVTFGYNIEIDTLEYCRQLVTIRRPLQNGYISKKSLKPYLAQ